MLMKSLFARASFALGLTACAHAILLGLQRSLENCASLAPVSRRVGPTVGEAAAISGALEFYSKSPFGGETDNATLGASQVFSANLFL